MLKSRDSVFVVNQDLSPFASFGSSSGGSQGRGWAQTRAAMGQMPSGLKSCVLGHGGRRVVSHLPVKTPAIRPEAMAKLSVPAPMNNW